MQVTPRNISAMVAVSAGAISAFKANQDVKDSGPDSAWGYVGIGLAASIGVGALGSMVGGSVGRGIAAADVLGGVLAGGIIGWAIGNATKN